MTFLGFIFDDRPRPEMWALQCVYSPALVIIISWALIKFKRNFLFLALGIATLAGYFVLKSFREFLLSMEKHGGVYEHAYTNAVWFAAGIPFVAILLFYFLPRRR